MSRGVSEDLVAVGRDVLARGKRFPGDLEVFVEHSETTSIKAYQGEVESLVAGTPSGLGVRYVHGSRSGYAYTGDFSNAALDAVVSMAVSNAAVSDADEFVRLPDPPEAYSEVRHLWRPGLLETSIEKKIHLALEAERVALASPHIETVEESSYVDQASRVAILSSRGVEVHGEQTFCYVYLSAHARNGDEVQTGLGFDTAREPSGIDASAAGREAARRAAALLGARPCPTGRYTVVLDREAAAAVIGVAARALSADAVQKGRSLFAGRIGERLASDSFSLTDDGLHPDGMETSPFDDEGVPRGATPLVERGILKGFLHDTYTAAREGAGARSTGNAHRGGYRASPQVSSSNLILSQGQGTLEELVARVGAGVYIVGITGLHSGANPVTGEFSVGAYGHMIEDGAIGPPVREITIASDLVSLLTNVSDSAGDARWIPFHGSILVPSLAIDDVTVAGS
ncbi:MAG: TldD/PmbA family protein [Thermoleophilia bacterium]